MAKQSDDPESIVGKFCEDCGEDAVGFDAGPMQWLCANCYRGKPKPSMMVAGTPTDGQNLSLNPPSAVAGGGNR